MTQAAIARTVKEHIWGPVGSIGFHVALVALVVRLATTSSVEAPQGFATTLGEMKPALDLERELATLDPFTPQDVPETTPDTPTAEPFQSPQAAFEQPGDAAGIGPGDTGGFGTDAAGLAGIDFDGEANGPLTLIGLTKGRVAGGGGSVFGYGRGVKGDLVGTMYDLKRDAGGAAREPDYLADVRSMVEGRLGAKSFAPYFRITNQLYLGHLFVPEQSADNGPAAFGVAGQMEPRNWVVHYTGQFVPPENGRFRFVGMFDDLLMVFVDGKIAMEFLWTGDVTPWAPKDFVDQHACFAGRPLVYGDWIDLNTAKPRRIDILVGEHPGGRVGGVLMVQQEGKPVETAADGRPILPIFTVQMLTPLERSEINANPKWAFENPAPVFNAAVPRALARPKKANTDIHVDVI